MAYPNVAVVGAGPAGLTVARLLQVNNINCTVFELEDSRHARSQGGSLDLHEGAAQRALKEAGLYEEFLKVARPEGEVLKIFDPSEACLMDEKKNPHEGRHQEMHGRPEVDRVVLRGMLLDSLHADSCKWGRKLRHVEQRADGTYALVFDNETVEGFDLVVGADGAWSKVRLLVSEQKPYFSGITGIDVKISDSYKRTPELAERVGEGMCLTLGPNRGILSQMNGDGTIRTYGFLREAEDWHEKSGIDWSQPLQAKRAHLAANYPGWSPAAQDLILKSDDEVVVRPMYMLPVGFKWPHRAGVTLIGDAAHLMTPFAGVGVNVAMEDALTLSMSVVDAVKAMRAEPATDRARETEALAAATKAYEESMWVRAEAYAKQTLMYLDLFFHPRGAPAMIEHFEEKRAEDKRRAEAEKEKAKVSQFTAEVQTPAAA